MHPAEMGLRRYIENLRNNASQRAQLAEDLFARRNDPQLRHEALGARGEVLAYETILRRLDEEAAKQPSTPL